MVAVIVGLVAIHVLVPIRCWRNVPNKLRRRHEQDSQQWPKRFLPSRAHTRGGKAAVSLHAVVGQQAIMKEDETPDPMAIGLLGPAAVMSQAQDFPQWIEEFRLWANRGIGRKDAVRFLWRGYGPMDGISVLWHSRHGHSPAP